MVNHRMSSQLFGALICMAWCPLVLAQGIPDGPYFGQAPPGAVPERFAPDVYNYLDSITPDNTTWGVFNADGTEYYYTALNVSDWEYSAIWYTEMEDDGRWTMPQEASFSQTDYRDWKLTLSPDGQRLFFNSDRPTHTWNLNIWMCERTENGWSEPIMLPMSYSGQSDYVNSCSANGSLYYDSHRPPDGLFCSRPVNGQYTDFEYHDLNSFGAWHTAISPDEDFMILSSDGHADGYGNDDLYISFRNPDDTWSQPENLGSNINTAGDDYYCRISGDYLFYESGGGDYWVLLQSIHPAIKGGLDPNGPVENRSTGQRFDSIQYAINSAKPGATIVLEPGVYQETITLNKYLVIQSVDPNDHIYIGSTIIQSDMNKPVLTLGEYTWACEIAGMTLRAGSVGIMGNATNTTLRNCRIMDNLTHGVELSQVSSPHLLGCLITANGQAGIKMHATTTGRTPLYCEPIIENCYIVDNNEAGIVGGIPVIVDSVIQGQ
ncbi:right-handed parallel beta-helix repeat-containing protein [Planctomycetota bacterium]